MIAISDLVAASATLHDRTDLSNKALGQLLHEHVKKTRQLIAGRTLSCVAQDETLLDYFDPSKDSVTYLLLLHLQIQTLQETSGQALPADLLPSGRLWRKATHFLEAFDRVQVRYAGQEFRRLIEFVAETSRAVSKPILAAFLIRDAILRLDPSGAVLTSTHLLLIRLCLHAKAYTYALPVLDKHIFHLPIQSQKAAPKSTPALGAQNSSSLSWMSEAHGLSAKLSYKDYLRYFLYGGMVYMALKKWRKASQFLGIVISMPTAGAISMVMVEAYKKWVLVGLLEKGKLCPPPKVTSSHVAKMYHSLAKPYIALAQAFQGGNIKSLDAEIDAAREIWCNDNNMGLVSQLPRAFTTHAVLQVKSTFAALTLVELSQQAPSLPQDEDEIESAIASLVMSGVIDATLVHPPQHTGPKMLRFPAISSSSPLSRELDIQAQLREEKQRLENLMHSLKESNHSLGLNDEVIDSMQAETGWAGTGDSKSGLGEAEMEEDIMGDM